MIVYLLVVSQGVFSAPLLFTHSHFTSCTSTSFIEPEVNQRFGVFSLDMYCGLFVEKCHTVRSKLLCFLNALCERSKKLSNNCVGGWTSTKHWRCCKLASLSYNHGERFPDILSQNELISTTILAIL